VKLLSLMTYLGFVWALFVSLLPCAGRILRPNRDAVFEGRRPSRTHCLSGGATVGLGESGGDRRACTFGCLDGRSHGRRSGGMGGPRGQCRPGAGPDVLLTAGSLAVKTGGVDALAAGKSPARMRASRPSHSAPTHQAIRPIPMRPFSSARRMSRCAVDSEYQHDWVVGPFQSLSTAVFFTGNFFVNGPAVGGQLVCLPSQGHSRSTSPIQDALIPPTQQQWPTSVGGSGQRSEVHRSSYESRWHHWHDAAGRYHHLPGGHAD
jgi:hypothetical protein